MPHLHIASSVTSQNLCCNSREIMAETISWSQISFIPAFARPTQPIAINLQVNHFVCLSYSKKKVQTFVSILHVPILKAAVQPFED